MTLYFLVSSGEAVIVAAYNIVLAQKFVLVVVLVMVVTTV